MATRRERVILDLETNFPREAAVAAASIRLLREEIEGLGKGSKSNSTKTLERDIDNLSKRAERGGSSLDNYTGRLSAMATAAAALGPMFIPIGAVGIPALTGLASSFGFAAVGAGTMIGALQGVGDALEALNKAHLDPTTENINAAKLAMANISPAAQDFTRDLEGLVPQLKQLRDIGATNMLPGFSEGLDALETTLPTVQRLVGAGAGELGDLGAEAGKSLAGPRWADFFTFLQGEAPLALAQMAQGLGNVAHAMSQLWMSFAPLNHDFGSWMVNASADFDTWATGLAKTRGFQEFIDYVRSNGPVVAETIGKVSNALLQVTEAASPLGGPVLHTVGAFADALASFADSDLGTPLLTAVSALSALSLATRVWGSASEKATMAQTKMVSGYKRLSTGVRTFNGDLKAASSVGYLGKTTAESAKSVERLSGNLRSLGKGAALMGGLAVATTGVADSMGVANAASLGLMGFGVGGGVGAAVGAGAGLMLDLAHSTDSAKDAVTHLNAAMRTGDAEALSQGLANAKKQLDDMTHSSGIGDTIGDFGKGLADAAQGAFSGHYVKDDLQSSILSGSMMASSKKAAAAQSLLAHGFSLTAAGANAANMSVQGFAASLETMDARLSQRAGLRDYKAALDDFTAGLAQNGRTLNINTAAGRANQANLDNIAATALKVGGAMELGSAKQSMFMQKARKGFINAAVAAGMSRDAAQRLASRLISVDRLKVNPKISVNTGQAMSQVRALRSLILDATKPRTGSITIKRHVVGGVGALLTPDLPGHAAGGYITGPGGPRDDLIPAMLSNREYVMPAASVEHYGLGFMEAIRAQQFALGGLVSPTHEYARSDFSLAAGGGTAPKQGCGKAISSFLDALELEEAA